MFMSIDERVFDFSKAVCMPQSVLCKICDESCSDRTLVGIGDGQVKHDRACCRNNCEKDNENNEQIARFHVLEDVLDIFNAYG